jgi:nicotinate-nucleotide adenylyltransferase
MMSPKSEPLPPAPRTEHLRATCLGILGGSFNPVHNGHLAIARQTRNLIGLDQILFVPAGDPPHKSTGTLAPAKDRYEMLRLAIASDPTFAVSDVEIKRPGKSYTLDTIQTLRQQYSTSTRLFFLIGLDAFLDFPTWREPATLLTLCSFVVISRPGISFQSLASMTLLPAIPTESLAALDAGRRPKLEVPLSDHQFICVHVPPTHVSASDIRNRVRQGQSVTHLLPATVESYIIQHHLY